MASGKTGILNGTKKELRKNPNRRRIRSELPHTALPRLGGDVVRDWRLPVLERTDVVFPAPEALNLAWLVDDAVKLAPAC